MRNARWCAGAAIVLVVAVSLPRAARAQSAPPGAVTDRNQIPVLAAKPGCWQFLTRVSQTGMEVRSLDAIRKEWSDKITPDQRAKLPPGYVDQMAAAIQAGEQKAKDTWEKGSTTGNMVCPLNDAKSRAFETIAFGDARCTRTVAASARALDMHVVCPAQSGAPESHFDTRFELPDEGSIRGNVRSTADVGKPLVQIVDVTGKWIAPAVPHMPSDVTDVNGKKPVGPQAVAALDPFRIVATIDGKQMVAGVAWAWINRVPPSERNGYSGRLPELLQKLYSQIAISDSAVKMGLNYHEPWQTQLRKLGRDAAHAVASVTNYPGDPNVPPALLAQVGDAGHHIMYDAFLAQAPTDAEQKELVRKIDEKYKIAVVDRDFFNGQTGP
jgi:hypothetical protein